MEIADKNSVCETKYLVDQACLTRSQWVACHVCGWPAAYLTCLQQMDLTESRHRAKQDSRTRRQLRITYLKINMSYTQKKDRNGDENGVVMWSTVELSNISYR